MKNLRWELEAEGEKVKTTAFGGRAGALTPPSPTRGALPMTQGRKGHVHLREENPQRKAREPSCLKGKSRSSSPPDASERRLAGTGGCEPQPPVGGAAGKRCEGALAAAVGRQRPELGWEPATLGSPSATPGRPLPAAAGSAAPCCQYLLRARRGGRAESGAAEPQPQPQPPAGRTPAPPPSPRGHRSPRAMAPGNSSRNFSAPEARNGSGEKGGKRGERPGKRSRGWGPAEAARPRIPGRPGAFSTGGRTAPGPGLRHLLAPQPPGLGGREGRLEPGRPPGRGAESIPPQPPVFSAKVGGGGAGREVLKGARWLQVDFYLLSPRVSYRI